MFRPRVLTARPSIFCWSTGTFNSADWRDFFFSTFLFPTTVSALPEPEQHSYLPHNYPGASRVEAFGEPHWELTSEIRITDGYRCLGMQQGPAAALDTTLGDVCLAGR